MNFTFQTQTVRMQFFSDTGFEDMEILQVPEYRQIYKAVLKYEIQTLLQKLSDTGEESVVLTASIHDDSATQLGSIHGKDFLQSQANLQGQFLCFCKDKLKGHGSKFPREIVSYQSAGQMGQSSRHPNVKQKQDVTSKSAINRASECSEMKTADPLPCTSVTPPRPQLTLEGPRCQQEKKDNSNKGREITPTEPVDTGTTEKDWDVAPSDLVIVKTEHQSDMESTATESTMAEIFTPSATENWNELTLTTQIRHLKSTPKPKLAHDFAPVQELYEQTIRNDGSEKLRSKSKPLHDSEIAAIQEFYDKLVECDGKYSVVKEGTTSHNEAPLGIVTQIAKESHPLDKSMLQREQNNSLYDPLVPQTIHLLPLDINVSVSTESVETNQSSYMASPYQVQQNISGEQIAHRSDHSHMNMFLQRSRASKGSGNRKNSQKTLFQNDCCTVCGKRVSPGYRHQHLMFHRGEKPFRCEYCPRQFTAANDWRKHTRIHTGETPYKCSFCGKAFTDNSNYNRHLRRHHPQE